MKDVRKMAVSSGLFDTSEIRRAIAFLHDLGSLQHFTTHFLKSRVVIDPQWIVDVMARVVNVKESVIKDGKLRHCDVRKIWKEFPKHLDEWLLRLTEEYDLTFPLTDKSLNLVPCLLPENPPPNFKWPDVRKGERETKMIYKFQYLPLGLFNRVQVTSPPIMHQSVMYLDKVLMYAGAAVLLLGLLLHLASWFASAQEQTRGADDADACVGSVGARARCASGKHALPRSRSVRYSHQGIFPRS